MTALGGPQLDSAFLEEWGERFAAAWNTHDPEAVVALCTEDVGWSDPALPGSPTEGRAAVRDFASFTFTVFPDFRVEDRESIYVSWTEPMALCPYRMTGTAAGSRDVGIAPGAMAIDGIDRWTFRDGLLCRYDTYYDHAEMMRQVTGAAQDQDPAAAS
jgi:ketosteroid isomerase-like protein